MIGDEEDQLFELEPEGEKAPPEFCLLLWVSRGGQVGLKSKPIFSSLDKVHGNCGNPTDCGQCPLMQQEIEKHPPGHAIWICPGCIKEAISKAKSTGTFYYLPGHYTEGLCQYVNCERPTKHSTILQLFIGDINH